MYLFSPDDTVCSLERQTRIISAVETLFEQGSGNINEDILLQNGNLYGVFDEATSLEKSGDTSGKTGGLLAAESAARVFSRNGGTLCQLAALANHNIRELMEARGVDLNCRRYLWSTSCMVVRIDKDGLEWFQIGDSLAPVLYEDGSHRLLADPIDHDRETLCLWKEWEPSATGTIRDSLADQILKVREGMNRAPTHRFKEQWGAEVRPLAWHIFSKKPNSWSPNRESLVIEPWKQLDLNLSRETGPELRRWISL